MKWFSMAGVATATALALVSVPATAAFPERPITLIVPWGAGGGTDATARIIGSIMEKELGKPVNVVNRAGGNGVVGHKAIAEAKPDGYTIGLATVEITMMHYIGLTDLTYKAYTPLALMNFDPSGVTVATNSPFKTLDDLLDAAKAEPGKLKASGTGEGGIWHLALAGMLNSLDIKPDSIRWVPSDGAAPGMLELVAGGVDVAPVSIPEARSMIDAGKAKPLAVMANEPPVLYPDVPTLKSLTGSDWTMGAWRGMVAPAGLPAEVTAKYVEVLDKINHSAEYRDFMNKQGYGIAWDGGEKFGEFMAKSDADMGEVLNLLGMAKK
ncbi:tripartite tricarboxylate transporter substrate binding protein [Castellaniella sp.]|uniref:tripartite tricarboxylate transporter substrate binding protein n=1 Tax=Castellaniella sp. TaxID=1955812 RepID=UPI00356041F9